VAVIFYLYLLTIFIFTKSRAVPLEDSPKENSSYESPTPNELSLSRKLTPQKLPTWKIPTNNSISFSPIASDQSFEIAILFKIVQRSYNHTFGLIVPILASEARTEGYASE